MKHNDKKQKIKIFKVDQWISSVKNIPNIDDKNIQKTMIVKTNNVEYCLVKIPNCNLWRISMRYLIRIRTRIEKIKVKKSQTRRFVFNVEMAFDPFEWSLSSIWSRMNRVVFLTLIIDGSIWIIICLTASSTTLTISEIVPPILIWKRKRTWMTSLHCESFKRHSSFLSSANEKTRRREKEYFLFLSVNRCIPPLLLLLLFPIWRRFFNDNTRLS